ncbi:MAG: uroporphyrinogen decarboxylase family protein [Nitrososphaeria archaeon]
MFSHKERVLRAINHETVDYIPLTLRWTLRNFLKDKSRLWKNEIERACDELKLGLDPVIEVKFPAWRLSNEVKEKTYSKSFEGEQFLIKEYETPNGNLTKIIRLTRDWPHGTEIPIFDDFQAPKARTKKYLIENEDDLKAFSALFRCVSESELQQFLECYDKIKKFADENDLPLINNFNVTEKENTFFLGDALAWVYGIGNMITLPYRNPSLLEKILDTLLTFNKIYLKTLLGNCELDIICYRGWYENTLFWSPKLYRKYIMPRIKELIEIVHHKKTKFCYIMTSNFMPLIETLKDMSIDILFGPDPVQGKIDMLKLKNETEGKLCLWGGINAPITVGLGGKEKIESAVLYALQMYGNRGDLILSAIDTLEEHFPWSNIECMISIWKKISGIT